MFKLSPARLRSWERAQLVEPSAELDSRPAFEFRDLVCVRSVLSLLERGVPMNHIRRSVQELKLRVPEMERPAGALRVWDAESRRVVARHGDVLIEPCGQTLLDLDSLPAEAQSGAVVPLPGEPNAEDEAPTAADWFEQGCCHDTDPATYRQAIEAYRNAVELDPEFTDAHCNLGAVLYNQGQREAARACFAQALELDPGHLESNLNLANLLEEEDRNESALHHYKLAMVADPLRADVQLNLALLYEKLGLRRTAREHWRRYLQREPQGSWADIARSRFEEE